MLPFPLCLLLGWGSDLAPTHSPLLHSGSFAHGRYAEAALNPPLALWFGTYPAGPDPGIPMGARACSLPPCCRQCSTTLVRCRIPPAHSAVCLP